MAETAMQILQLGAQFPFHVRVDHGQRLVEQDGADVVAHQAAAGQPDLALLLPALFIRIVAEGSAVQHKEPVLPVAPVGVALVKPSFRAPLDVGAHGTREILRAAALHAYQLTEPLWWVVVEVLLGGHGLQCPNAVVSHIVVDSFQCFIAGRNQSRECLMRERLPVLAWFSGYRGRTLLL